MHERATGRWRATRPLRRPRRGLRAAVWMVALLVVVIGAAVAAAALRLARVGDDLRSARDLLDAASGELEDGRLADARASLADARALLVGANAQLYGTPDLTVVGALPVAATNLEAIRSAVSTALGATGAAERVLRAAAPLEAPGGDLEVPLRGGAIPLDAVAAVRAELDALAAALPAGSAPDSPALLAPVRELVTTVHEGLDRHRPRVANLGAGLTLAEELTGGNGDRRYLIAVANTAEMRATGGMILSYGILEGRAGDISLPTFGPIDELFLAAPVDLAGDVGLERWSGLEPQRLWRNANLTPDPSSVAPRLEAMAEGATGLPFDGVLHVDPHGLAAVLTGVGPVLVDGLGLVDATNVVDLTLHDAYARFPDSDQRREVLGDVAEAAFRRLVDGEYASLRTLGEAVGAAAAERHLALWSARPGAAGPAAFFAADAAVPAPDAVDHLVLTVQNLGRDKLDYFLDTSVEVRGERPAGRPGDVTVTLTFTNHAPGGVTTPAYVFGSDENGRDGPVGHYLGVASVYVPIGTTLVASAGGSATTPALQAEAGRSVVGFDVDVAPGATATITLELRLPPRPYAPYQLELAPPPRVRPTTWDVELDTGDGTVVRRGPLTRKETLVGAFEGR